MKVDIPKKVIVTQEYIEASEWVNKAPYIVRRDTLSVNDPDSYWQLWEQTFGGILPIDFQKQIWNKIIFLENDLEKYNKHKREGWTL